MQALGNDFVMIDARDVPVALSAEQLVAMSDRRYGIGFDQLLYLQASSQPGVDFHCRFFNADASEAEQCGNGLRAIVVYLHELTDWTAETVRMSMANRQVVAKWLGDGQVQVDMGAPQFGPVSLVSTHRVEEALLDSDWQDRIVVMGNPHFILSVTDDSDEILAERAQQVARAFSQGINVGFVRIEAPDRVSLHVYERGVGWTEACGSGACAAVAYGQRYEQLAHTVQVTQPGGTLSITRDQKEGVMLMSGTARWVYQGLWPEFKLNIDR